MSIAGAVERFNPGRYVIFRDSHNGRRYFTGKIGRLGPRESFHVEHAAVFQSAAHAYCFGGERRELQQWRVGRV